MKEDTIWKAEKSRITYTVLEDTVQFKVKKYFRNYEPVAQIPKNRQMSC